MEKHDQLDSDAPIGAKDTIIIGLFVALIVVTGAWIQEALHPGAAAHWSQPAPTDDGGPL